MHRTQILLDPQQHKDLSEIARQEKRSMSKLVREMLQDQLRLHKQQQLGQAAQALLHDYQTNTELIGFTALDGEDLHAQG